MSTARGINEAGQVVGYSGTPGDERHAFITGADGMGMRDLGSLGGNDSFDFSVVLGINDAGQVSYSSTSTAGGVQHAFITGPNGAGRTDLNSLVHLPGGMTLTEATGINNAGQVIAIAPIPEPEIYALFLAGLGLIGFIGRQKKMSGKIFSPGQAGS